MRSLFPTGADQTRCLFNASLDFPQVRLAPGSPLEPAAPASASQRRLPDLTSVPDPGLASGLRCTFGVSAPLADPSVSTNLRPKSSPSQTARFPLLLDRSVRRRRIFAPNSLLLRRLNVPQTSWNRFNSAPTGPQRPPKSRLGLRRGGAWAVSPPRPGRALSSAASTAPAPLPADPRATRPFQPRRPPSPGNDCVPVMPAPGNDLRVRSKAPVGRDTGSGNSSNESSVHRVPPGWTDAHRLIGPPVCGFSLKLFRQLWP